MMDRLTFKHDLMGWQLRANIRIHGDCDKYNEAMRLLAAYEDTNLTPADIADLQRRAENNQTCYCSEAAECERLRIENERLRALAPAWIDVNDRLPEHPEHDWVLCKVMLMPEGFYGVPQIAELRRDGKWHARDMDTPYEETVSAKITHWMPIPDPIDAALEGGPQ